MPARRIPKNHLVVTGSFASRKNAAMDQFESLLEKEYMLLLDFDDEVERFDVQPITIPLPGIPRGYTPDVLVHYRPDPETGEVRRSLLTEIKHTDELSRNADKYAQKFQAAERFADEAGWEFRIVTQVDIRTPRLSNIKFLREYRNITPEASEQDRVVEMLELRGGAATPGDLLALLASSEDDHLYWLPVIWHSLLGKRVFADLNARLDHDSILTLREALP